jgi:hypothetical protein
MSLLLAAGGTGYTLSAQAGSYTITGQAATLSLGFNLNATAGAYAIAGGAATFGYSLTCAAGAYTISGKPAVLSWSGEVIYSLECEPGAYQIDGADATLVNSGAALGGGEWTRKKKKYYAKVGDDLLVFSNDRDAQLAILRHEEALERAEAEAAKPAPQPKPVYESEVFVPAAPYNPPDFALHLDRLREQAMHYQAERQFNELMRKQKYDALLLLNDRLRRQEEEDVLFILMAA